MVGVRRVAEAGIIYGRELTTRFAGHDRAHDRILRIPPRDAAERFHVDSGAAGERGNTVLEGEPATSRLPATSHCARGSRALMGDSGRQIKIKIIISNGPWFHRPGVQPPGCLR